MKNKALAIGLIVMGAIGCLLGFPSEPSSAVVTNSFLPPSAEEIQLVEELASWVHGAPEVVSQPEPITVGAQVNDRRESFDLFRNLNRVDGHSRVLGLVPYGSLMEQTARQVQIDGLLIAAVAKTESGFNPRVVSSRGALGLMQLMPATATQYGIGDPINPESNILGGARYLRDLLVRFDGDLVLALAAYNAGPGNVRKYGGVPPFPETQRYVEKVLDTYIGYHRELWHENEITDLLETLVPASGAVS